MSALAGLTKRQFAMPMQFSERWAHVLPLQLQLDI